MAKRLEDKIKDPTNFGIVTQMLTFNLEVSRLYQDKKTVKFKKQYDDLSEGTKSLIEEAKNVGYKIKYEK